MFELHKILTAANYGSRSVRKFLDENIHPEFCRESRGDKEFYEEWWAGEFIRRLPRIKRQRLDYICHQSGSYSNQNMVGRICQKYVWPEFFKSFSNGKILIVKLSDSWLEAIYRREADHVFSADSHPFAFDSRPQKMSGLVAEFFPANVLLIASYGFYPLMLFDYANISGNLFLIYVPDVGFEYSQMNKGGAYGDLLWNISHVLNDQWTFDGFRGWKSRLSQDDLKPLDTLTFLEWVISRVSERLADLLSVSNYIECEQMAMTFSRAVCDCVLSVSSELPYMSKVFFFSCLDKLANLHVQSSACLSEQSAWERLVDKSFLSGELTDFLSTVPNPIGKLLSGLVSSVCNELEYSELSPTYFRDFRNTLHGYKLRPGIVKRIYEHSGELNNDMTLLATPLVLYYLAKKWT
jgi:hypothetical protein